MKGVEAKCFSIVNILFISLCKMLCSGIGFCFCSQLSSVMLAVLVSSPVFSYSLSGVKLALSLTS